MDSLKKSLICSFYSLSFTDEMKDSKIVILTHSGIITGTPIAEDEPDQSIQCIKSFSKLCATDYRQEHSLDNTQPLDGSDGFLPLKDVHFKSGGISYTFNYLNVFFDQIIGITLDSGK